MFGGLFFECWGYIASNGARDKNISFESILVVSAYFCQINGLYPKSVQKFI